MGKRKGIELLLLTALPAFASSVSVPVPRLQHNPVLIAIPDANLLMHGQYRLNGRFQYFTSSELGEVDTSMGDTAGSAPPVEAQNLNYNSELLFGIENRAEIGIQYGRALSFSVKGLVWREDLFWPDIVFGARNLFASQEGGLYGVTSGKTLKGLQSESYLTLAKSFAGRTRAHAGVSILSSTKGYVSINGGLEQSLGAGAYLGYEVFERFSDFHQVLTLQWRYKDLVGFSLAMTEFQSWIRQDGQWGFFMTPPKNNPDGYNSPGISLSVQVLGWVPRREKRTLPERVAILEVKNAELARQVEELESLKQRLAEIERHGVAPMEGAGDSLAPSDSGAPLAEAIPAGPAQQAAVLLRDISVQSESDLSDPRAIRDMMQQVTALGPQAMEVVKHTAADTAAGSMRVHAVLIMAHSKDPGYEASLRALCADADPRIRREALSALVKLGSRAALEDAKRLLSDPDETVALAAGEAYRQLKASPKAAPASRKRR